jgi:hypothetical protein
VGSNTETADPVPHEMPDNEESGHLTQTSGSEPSSSSSVELMLTNFMAVIQEGNRKENIKSDINSVRADINTSSEKLEQFRANLSTEIAGITTEVKVETDRLIRRTKD